jgi:hypothetical protein
MLIAVFMMVSFSQAGMVLPVPALQMSLAELATQQC